MYNLNLIISVELLVCATDAHINKTQIQRENSCHLQAKVVFLIIYVTILLRKGDRKHKFRVSKYKMLSSAKK